MINSKLGMTVLWVGMVLALLMGAWNTFHVNSPTAGSIDNGAAVQNYPFWFTNGVYAGSSQQWGITSSGVETVNGITNNGNLTVTTSNTATSTATVGCVQMYATSTATAIHLEFSTSTVNATYSGGVAPTGAVAWRYGACPV